ncbi:MAG: LysM peptidoglycan-binding domain-containing protein, partial [Bacteroidota bacterium]
KEEAYAANYSKKSSKKSSKTKTQTYTVKRGDNLGAICQKYGVSLTQVKQWNKIKGNNIHPGQRLTVGKTTTVIEPKIEEAVAAAPAKKQETKAVKGKEADVKTAAKQEDALADATTVGTEVAAAEDTKAAIAANTKKQAREISNYEEARMYIVQKGDSLFSIAKKHPGITVENLKNWNKINGNSIQPGMKLKIGETAN